jgi:hypothetical protein
MLIGALNNSTSGEFDGLMDDVRIYDIALSEEYISKLLD